MMGDPTTRTMMKIIEDRNQLIALVEHILHYQVRNDWMELPIWVRARIILENAKSGGEA